MLCSGQEVLCKERLNCDDWNLIAFSGCDAQSDADAYVEWDITSWLLISLGGRKL